MFGSWQLSKKEGKGIGTLLHWVWQTSANYPLSYFQEEHLSIKNNYTSKTFSAKKNSNIFHCTTLFLLITQDLNLLSSWMRQRWEHCMRKQKLDMRKTSTITLCSSVFLTSTTTDTAALTKMMMKSFILHSYGTQTICTEKSMAIISKTARS